MTDDLLGAELSVIVDISLGHIFRWQWLDRQAAARPALTLVPIVLRGPPALCLERIAQRAAADPTVRESVACFATNPGVQAVYDFLEQLDRPDVVSIDAARPFEEVYADVRRLAARAA